METEVSKKEGKKAWGMFVILAVVLIGVIWFIVHQVKVSQYTDKLVEASETMTSGSEKSEELIDGYIDTWDYAIENDYDFSTEIYSQQDTYDEDGKLDTVKKSMKKAKKQLDDLRNPPSKYKKEYEVAVDMYTAYKRYAELSIEPEGSLMSYREKTYELSETITSKADKLDALIED